MKSNRLLNILGAAAVLGTVAFPVPGAYAQSASQVDQISALSVPDWLSSHSAIVFGDIASAASIDGRVIATGNVTGGSYLASNRVLGDGVDMIVGGNLAGSVHAGGPNYAVVLGSLTTTSLDVPSGTIAIGGAIPSSFASTFNGAALLMANSVEPGARFIGGGGEASLDGYSMTRVRGSFGAVPTVTPVSTNNATARAMVKALTDQSRVELSAIQPKVLNYSAELADASANAQVVASGSTLHFTTERGATGAAVFDISGASLLNSATAFAFSLNGVDTILVNVHDIGADAIMIGANFLGGFEELLGANTIWNFSDATGDITIDTHFGGTILAALANVTINGDVEGTVVAKNLIQNADIHYVQKGAVVVAPTPLPAALPLFGFSLIAFAGGARIRRGRESRHV